jgi:transglutaminase-like putative cysteine protease
MLLEVRYASEFEYAGAVRESHNMLRACPVTDDHQRLMSYAVTVEPSTRMLSHTDYWGTRVDEFGIRPPHERLLVVAESVVDTSVRPVPDEIEVPLAAYETDEVVLGHHELLQRSPHTAWDDALAEVARSSVEESSVAGSAGSGEGSAVAAIQAIHDRVVDIVDYVPGATFVGMDVNQVMIQGQGVCQDFAHLAVAMCRSVGIPARYVSGYLYTSDQTTGEAPVEAEVEIQTHAWIEALVPGWGWWALDPTNRSNVGEQHIKIGHGRDYDDVLPLRGTYHGPADHLLGVQVRISRESLSALAAMTFDQ